MGISIDLVEEFELILAMPVQLFLGKIFIKEKYVVIDETKTGEANVALWCNRSKLDQGIEAVIMWKQNNK